MKKFYYTNHKAIFHIITMIGLLILTFFTNPQLFSLSGFAILAISNLICANVIYNLTGMKKDADEYFKDEKEKNLKDF